MSGGKVTSFIEMHTVWEKIIGFAAGILLFVYVQGVAEETFENIETLTRSIELQNENGKIEEAVERYRSNVKRHPENFLFHYGLGYALLLRGEHSYPEAVRQFQKAIELNAQSMYPHYCLAFIYEEQGKYALAVTEYEKAIAIEPEEVELHNYLGLVYSKMGDFGRASRSWREAIKLNPEFADAHNNLGTIYAHDGPLEKALDEYQKAIQINPEKGVYHYNLALCYESLQKMEEAIKEYEEAIRLEPTNYSYMLTYATTFFILKDWDKTLSIWEKALEFAPGNREKSRLSTDIASIYYHQKQDLSKAKTYLNKALQWDRNNQRATSLLENFVATEVTESTE